MHQCFICSSLLFYLYSVLFPRIKLVYFFKLTAVAVAVHIYHCVVQFRDSLLLIKMTEVVDHKELNSGHGKHAGGLRDSLLLDKFRVRMCRTVDVPILMDCPFLDHSQIVVIDMPTVETTAVERETNDFTESELSTDGPLSFDFLSLEKLEQQCKMNGGGFPGCPVVTSTSCFDCNPLDAPTAFDLRNRLMRRKLPALLDETLLDLPICIIANAKDLLRTTFVGFHSSTSKITTFHTRNLGRFGELREHVLRNLHHRFEGLESQSKGVALYSILEKSSRFCDAGKFPCNMKLTFKWEETMSENYLCRPPLSASALFYVAPGWKDERIALFESTKELEYLLLMANVLDSGSVMVWPTADENTSEDMLTEVRNLIMQYSVPNDDIQRALHDISVSKHGFFFLKTFRDMVEAYITAGLVTSIADLEFKSGMNSTPEERARDLLPFHLALQTIFEMKRHVALPPHMLIKMTRSVVTRYRSSPITDFTKVSFEAAVPTIYVGESIFRKLPDLWTYETTYSSESSVVAHTFLIFTPGPQLRFLGRRELTEVGLKDGSDRRNAFQC
ncbi:hypothetical protein Angca_007104, partial [Angiostrongylus cantonensis]